jgi:hypothetical protein
VTADDMPAWIRDLLLESPVPPSSWMPSRAERLADARDTLRRRFGQQRFTSTRAAHRLRDFSSAHPFASGTRYVSGQAVEADLEADITSVNPPVIQGWAYLLLPFVAAGMVVGIGLAGRPDQLGPAILGLLGAPAAWLLVLVAWGSGQRAIELGEDGVRVPRWTDIWLRRPRSSLGGPETLRATLDGGRTLVIDGPDGDVRLSIRTWSATARADMHDELPIWGIDCRFGEHQRAHGKHPGRRRRGRRSTASRRTGPPG